MKYPILFLLTIAFLHSCANTNQAEIISDENGITVSTINSSGPNRLTGLVSDVNGSILPSGKVMLIQNDAVIKETDVNRSGRFQFENVTDGIYKLEVNRQGYASVITGDLDVQSSMNVDFKLLYAKEPEMKVLKPVIYLYPEKEMDISVALNYKGNLIHTYPKYPIDGWKVKAQPDGTLFDEKGMEYYALFWEGKPTEAIAPTNGFVVAGDETATFLEEKLAELGLNRREANEFIMFWLPQMENNPFNLIHFSGDAYEESAELNITPAPETIIRVMMITKPLKEKIKFPKQDISTLKKERKGYTAVEWGGSNWPSVVN